MQVFMHEFPTSLKFCIRPYVDGDDGIHSSAQVAQEGKKGPLLRSNEIAARLRAPIRMHVARLRCGK